VTRDDLIYLGAFLDGEGWICATRRRRTNRSGTALQYVLTVGIVNTHEPTIRYVHSLLGGSVFCTHHERLRPLWRWQVQQGRARDVLRQLSPFLRIKTEQARLAIELWRIVDEYKASIEHVNNCGRVLPLFEQERRDGLVTKIKALNHGLAV
jgi:hypothetical protein